MNTSDSDAPSTTLDDFDARAKRAHAAAQDALSPRVRAQLQQRRRAALADTRTTQGVRWVPTLTMAATLALAVGLGLRLWSPAALDIGTGAAADAPGRTGDAPSVAATDTTPTAPSPSNPQDGTGLPAVAAVGGDAHAVERADSGDAGDPRAAEASAGKLDADFDAIAALLAAPAGGATDSADDADIAQDDALLAALEESPDFYLWLGADDGVEAL